MWTNGLTPHCPYRHSPTRPSDLQVPKGRKDGRTTQLWYFPYVRPMGGNTASPHSPPLKRSEKARHTTQNTAYLWQEKTTPGKVQQFIGRKHHHKISQSKAQRRHIARKTTRLQVQVQVHRISLIDDVLFPRPRQHHLSRVEVLAVADLQEAPLAMHPDPQLPMPPPGTPPSFRAAPRPGYAAAPQSPRWR